MPTLADLRAKLPDLQGLDDQQAISVIQQVYYPAVPVETIAARLGYKAPASTALPERSKLAAINDTVIEAANAVAGGVGSVADFVAPGNAVSKFIDENIVRPGQEKQSDRKKAINARLAEDIAGAQGIGDQVGAALRYAKDDPAGLLGMAAGSFAIPLGAIKGAGMLAKSLGVAEGAATKAALAGGALTGAALSGGDAAGQAYEESLKAGATEEQAQAAARQASVIPAVVGGAGGMLGAERIFAGAKGFKGNAISRALKTGASEGAQEFGEEFATQYEANRAVAPYDGRDPMQGAVAAGTLGALAGAPIGMLTGAVAGGSPPAAAVPRAEVLRLGNSPDPYISFPDGTVGKRADVERYINSLPEASRAAARAKFMGLAPQKADPVAAILAADTVDTAINAARRAVGYKVPRIPVGAASDLEPDQTIIAPATPGRGRTPDEIARQGREEIAAQEEAIRRRFPPATGEATEILPTGDATELEPIPTPDATEIIPAADAQEIEPIPAGDASEETPAPDAYEVPPVGEATEVIPTGDAMEVPRIPTGKATEIEPETVQADDLLTGDGMPYGSKTAANVRAKKEGLGPANVVEIPGAGWVVRPQPTTMGRAGINAQPAGTRGTTAADLLKAPDAPNPARPAGPRPADAGRGDGAGVLPVVQPGDVAAGAAAASGEGAAGGGADGPGAGGRDEALMADMAALRKKWPGLKGESDERILAAEEWDKAQNRVRAAYEYRGTVASDIQDAYVDEVGQAWIAKNQTAYNLELARRLNAEADRVQALENTPGTLESKRAERKSSKQREESAAAADKALSDDITFNIARVREMERQGRLPPAEAARLLELARGATDKFDAAMRLEGFVAEKQVAPSDTRPVGRGDAPANDAAPPAAKQGPTSEGATDEGLQGQGQGRREEVAAGARAQAGAPAEGAGASRPTPAPAPASEAAAEPWKLTREQAAKDYPGDEYDRMLNRHGDLGDLSYTEVDRRARVNSLGQRKLWAKTRAQLEQEGKDAVKAARGDRAATNKLKSTPEFANWRLKAMSRNGKEAIADAERLAREYLAIHKDRVQEALMEGKDVPAEVLADYPDLKRSASEATPTAPAPTLAERVKQRREKAAEPDVSKNAPELNTSPQPAQEAPKTEQVATHKDPGQPAEPATAPVIAQALSKAAVKEALSRSAMKAEALRLVDAAIAAAPSSAEVDALIRISGPITISGKKELSGVRTFGENSEDQSIQVKARETRDGKWTVTNDSFDGSGTGRKVGAVLGELVGTPAVARDQLMTLLRNLGPDGKVGKTDTVVIKVPGDGEFRVVNTRERLAEFRKKVEASPGFKDQRTTGMPPNRVNGYGMKQEPGSAFGVETGSGPKSEAFANMIEDGDLQAALDYAATVGIDPKTAKLSDVLRKRLDKFMRDEEMAAAVAARVPAAPAPAPQPEVDAAPAAEPAAEAPAPASDEPAKTKPAPKSFRKSVKVKTAVFMEETNTLAEQEIDADTAIKALDADIAELQAFRKCIAGG